MSYSETWISLQGEGISPAQEIIYASPLSLSTEVCLSKAKVRITRIHLSPGLTSPCVPLGVTPSRLVLGLELPFPQPDEGMQRG